MNFAICPSKRAVSRLQGILDCTNHVLDLSLGLIRLAVNLQLSVTDDLADGFLDRALELFGRSDDPVLIHRSTPLYRHGSALGRAEQSLVIEASGQGVCSTASSSMTSPTLEISLPAPAVVLHAPRSGTAPRSAIRVRVGIMVLLDMVLPLGYRIRDGRERGFALSQIRLLAGLCRAWTCWKPRAGDAWSGLNPPRQQQDDNDEKDDSEATAWKIAPALAVRPGWQGADQEQHQEDE